MIKSLVKTREKLRKNKKGFTLIELLVVIAILAVLAAILIPVVGGFITSARQSAADADAHTVFTAATTYAAQHSETIFTGYAASGGTATQISDADLEAYLGSDPTKWKFTITKIKFDPNGGVVGAEVNETTPNVNGTYGDVS